MEHWSPSGSITDVEGVKVGHFTDTRRPTGCTVVLTEEGAVAGVDVRGGAPGTRETDLLNPVNTVSRVNAIVLSGGSAFGLASADGVVRYLEEKGFGYQADNVRVPIVPAAILFDLGIGDSSIRPTAESGYKACQAVPPSGSTRAEAEQGNIGAGAGATVGKLLGRERAMKGGLGAASLKLPGGLVVAALVAVNAVGDIYDYTRGLLLAGARTADGKRLADIMSLIRKGALPPLPQDQRRENSTIGVVATNASLSKTEATKVAQMAHDGLARSIQPVHTPSDGDTLFAISTGRLKAETGRTQLGAPLNLTLIGALAAEVTAAAVISAILHARGIPGYPAYSDLKK